MVPGTNYACSGSLGISLSPDRTTMPDEYKDPIRSLMGYVYD